MIILQLDSEQLSSLIQNAVRRVIDAEPNKINQSDSDELLTVKDVAKLLHLAIPTIYGLISKGEIPVMKGKGQKRCYFLKADIINYLKNNRRKTDSEITSEAHEYMGKQKKRR